MYDIAALYYHKEFANLNFKEKTEFYKSLIAENEDTVSNSPKLIRHLIDPKYKFVNIIRSSISEKIKHLKLTTEEIAAIYGVSKQVVKYALYPLVKKGVLNCDVKWIKSARAFTFSLPSKNDTTGIPSVNRLYLIGDVVKITKHKQKSLVGSVGIVTGYKDKIVNVTVFFMGIKFKLKKHISTLESTNEAHCTEEITTGDMEFIIHEKKTPKRIKFSHEDIELIKEYTWSISDTGQITSSIKINGKWCSRLLSKMVLNLPPNGTEVTHLNGDKLDVRRSNIVPTSFFPKNKSF